MRKALKGSDRRSVKVLVGILVAGVITVASLAATAMGGTTSKTISVAIVANPQMQDIASLTPSLFTAKTGVKVKYTILDEGKLRQVTTRDVGSGGKAFDAVMIGMYEAPQFGSAGLIQNLTPKAKADKAYNYSDLIPAVRNGLSAKGNLYASPFYGESSFLMYRKDVLAKAGVTMPLHPTWQQVATIAEKVNTPSMAGICLRGKPGWGDLGASFTTVLNTFGGTWWSAKSDGSPDKAQVDQPAFKNALDFYASLVQKAGEKDAANSSFNECLAQYQAGKVAMWYDATVAAGLLEAKDSPVKGKNGFAFAPTDKTKSSGWLWSWALAIPKSSPDAADAWKYISWATSAQYIKAAGTHTKGGWASIPPGTRFSTYALPQYKKAASTFAAITLAAMKAAPITNPGTTKRPGLPGVQYVGIPQFQDVGNRCTQLFSSVIAGSMKDTDALSQCQDIASKAIK
ncbi:MAG TPA: sugar ABC transporter substrate-binding protein [Gaiellaceae bacterium]|jgi:sorbitol/mannitol transport system substrate-binding protein|nr:sugar ABC transporter substrate-binding protein [Gaiellaceae bacterium]